MTTGNTVPSRPTRSSSQLQSSLSSLRHISSYAARRWGSVYPGHPISSDNAVCRAGPRKKIKRTKTPAITKAVLPLNKGFKIPTMGSNSAPRGSNIPDNCDCPAVGAAALFATVGDSSCPARSPFLRLPFPLPPAFAARLRGARAALIA